MSRWTERKQPGRLQGLGHAGLEGVAAADDGGF